MKTFYKGTFNYQGEIHTFYCYAASREQAHKFFCRRLARVYEIHVSRFEAYFNGSKDNYKIEVEKDK